MTSRETVIINTRADREKVARWADGVSEGTIVEFRKKTRSHEQSAKMHAMLGEVADQVVWYGSKLKVEDWKNMFTASLRKAQVVPGIDAGTVVPLGIHTSTMTVDEMSNMIEAIYAFGADPDHPVVFKDHRQQDQSNPGEESPSASAGEDAPAGGPASQDGESPAASPSSTPHDWLFNIARMLWAATNYNGDISVLRNQKVAAIASYPKPEDCPAIITGKAESVFAYCKQVTEGSIEPQDGLALVAGVVGCDQDDLKGVPA